MKYFWDATVPTDDNVLFRPTPAYVEVEVHSQALQSVMRVYVCVSGDGFVIGTCWGHQFDPLTTLIDDPKMGKTWFEVLNKDWPTFGRLYSNGLLTQLGEGALFQLQDPDDGDQKWMLGTGVGNLSVHPSSTSFEDVCNLMQYDDRMVQAYTLVAQSSLALFLELHTRKLSLGSKVKTYAMSVFYSELEAVDLAAELVPKLRAILGGW